MKIVGVIVLLVAINVMDNLAPFGARNLAMFKNALPRPVSALSLCINCHSAYMVLSGCFGGSSFHREYQWTRAAHSYVSPAQMSARRHIANLSLIRVQRVAMLAPHLVVAHTHFFCSNRPVTMQAITPNHSTTPPILGRSMTPNAFIVHQAEPLGSVTPFAPINRTCSHGTNIVMPGPRYKAMGNSWTTNVVRYLGEQIERLRHGQPSE